LKKEGSWRHGPKSKERLLEPPILKWEAKKMNGIDTEKAKKDDRSGRPVVKEVKEEP